MTLVLVYHNPGSALGLKLISSLAGEVSTAWNVNVKLVEVDDELPSGCRLAIALLPAPGGHLDAVKSKARGGCRVVGPIDWRVQARIVAYEFASRNCRGGVIFYWRAKRFKEAQDSWLSAIAGFASRLHGAPIALAGLDFGSPAPRGNGCAFALTVTPGRLASLLQSLGWRVASASLLSSEHGYREVLSWVLGELQFGDL